MEENKLVQEQIKNIQEDVKEIKEENKEFRKRLGMVETSTTATTQTILHMGDMMKRMETMVDTFTNSYSKKLDDQNNKLDTQSKKFDDFINSDKRRDSKKNFIVAVLQIGAGIVIAIIGFLAKGAV